MKECAATECDGSDSIPFVCNECGEQFCSEHRLPENHSCQPLMQTDADSGNILSTGLQNKRERERGPTKKLPNKPKSFSSNPKAKSNQRFWATWLPRFVGVALLFSILTILLVGFTPASMPNGVPPQVAETVENAGAAASAFVANLTNTSHDKDTGQDGSTQTSSEGSKLDGSSTNITAEPDTTSPIDVARVERLVHQNVNSERQSQELDTLSFDSDLQEIARYHSEDMAKGDYFAHTAPDGETMGTRYNEFNYQCGVSIGSNRDATGAENIFSMSFSGPHYSEETIATEAVNGWMNSPGHRENILKEYWKNEGIGVYVEEEDGKTKVYITQNFC